MTEAKEPKFDTMSTLNLVKCDINPLECMARHTLAPTTPGKRKSHFCWHDKSPRPD